jgi:hypothetical protein
MMFIFLIPGLVHSLNVLSLQTSEPYGSVEARVQSACIQVEAEVRKNVSAKSLYPELSVDWSAGGVTLFL